MIVNSGFRVVPVNQNSYELDPFGRFLHNNGSDSTTFFLYLGSYYFSVNPDSVFLSKSEANLSLNPTKKAQEKINKS